MDCGLLSLNVGKLNKNSDIIKLGVRYVAMIKKIVIDGFMEKFVIPRSILDIIQVNFCRLNLCLTFLYRNNLIQTFKRDL